MSYLYLNQAFNLFMGSDGPDSDKSKIIGNLQFPDLEELTAEHHPGGSRMSMTMGGMDIKPLVVRFSSNGWDPHAMGYFGIYARENQFFTLRASVRNKNGDKPVTVVCTVRGRMTKHTPGQMRRGDMFSFDHEIHEVDIYQLSFDGKPKYDFSFWDNRFQVDGVAQNADELAALGLSAG